MRGKAAKVHQITHNTTFSRASMTINNQGIALPRLSPDRLQLVKNVITPGKPFGRHGGSDNVWTGDRFTDIQRANSACSVEKDLQPLFGDVLKQGFFWRGTVVKLMLEVVERATGTVERTVTLSGGAGLLYEGEILGDLGQLCQNRAHLWTYNGIG